ncbi:MAG: glycosyltransferase [Lachnospiraceae bacterium]
MNEKKILFIVEAMGGGVFTYIVDLANELSNIHDMYIAYSVREQTPPDLKSYFNKKIHLIEVKNFQRSINIGKDFKAFFEIRKIADWVQPDIIHLHSSKAGVLGRWGFNGKKTPLFYTPHGYSFLMQNHSASKRFIYKTVEKLSGRRSCMTISCSEGEYKESLKLTKNTTYINNGINVCELQQLTAPPSVFSNNLFTVFTLGRICYQKNPGIFNQIAMEMPDVRFVWIGDGELRKELTAPNIEITGWCQRKEALQCSIQYDVFLLTSLWEGLPMSLLEAMYMRKPCVVSDVIGNHDVIHNRDNGFVCHNISEFVHAIREVQYGNVNDLIEKAHSEVKVQYNTAIMAEKYNAVYMSALCDTE